ncbi:MAG: family hydrolase [Flaviaesturariibacter sp.]|nr:family hydrolase [Flaviaesturariibacter sp.]
MRKQLLFDLDGTLVDSRPRLYHLFRELAPDCDLSFENYWILKRAKADHAMILRSHYGWDDGAIARFQEEWMARIELPAWLAYDTPFPGVPALLEALHEHADLYVFTARQSEREALTQLETLGLLRHFRKVFVTQQKLDKQQLVASSLLTIQPSDIVIGDTGVDVQLGKKLGCRTVAVTSGFRSREVLEEYHPDHIIDSVDAPEFLSIVDLHLSTSRGSDS